MSQHSSHKDRFIRIVNLANQPIGITFDVEDRTNASPICMWEFPSSFSKVIPLLFLTDHVPTSQRFFSVRMMLPKFSEFSNSYNVHHPSVCKFETVAVELSMPDQIPVFTTRRTISGSDSATHRLIDSVPD
jgi:hypothetical protein